MAAPAVVSSQVPAGETTKRFYDLQAQRTLRVPRLVGLGDARVLFTTDAITSGPVANLTTLGFSFPAGSVSLIRCRAYGRGTAATLFQVCELVGAVMMNTTTPVIGNATAVNVINIGGGTAATILLAVSGNDVLVNFTGAATAYNWILDINVEDPVGVTAGA